MLQGVLSPGPARDRNNNSAESLEPCGPAPLRRSLPQKVNGIGPEEPAILWLPSMRGD